MALSTRAVITATCDQELSIGYPNEPGMQRAGPTLWPPGQMKQRGLAGLDSALDQVQTILRSVKDTIFLPRAKRTNARC